MGVRLFLLCYVWRRNACVACTASYCGHVESFLESPGGIFLLACLDISFCESIFSPQFPVWRFYSERVLLLWKARHKVLYVCDMLHCVDWVVWAVSEGELLCDLLLFISIPPPSKGATTFPRYLLAMTRAVWFYTSVTGVNFSHTHTHTHRHTLRLHTLIQLILNMFSSLVLRQQSRSSEALFVKQIVCLSSARYFHFCIQFSPQHRYTFQKCLHVPSTFWYKMHWLHIFFIYV